MDSGLSFTELLAYSDLETAKWKRWFADHPQALDHPCQIANAGSVRELLFHVFTTELFFAHSVNAVALPDWGALPKQSVDDLFALSESGSSLFRRFITEARPHDWEFVQALGFGDLKASRRKMVGHAILHGVHHRAQLATFLRQEGFPGLWVHDFILTDVMV